MPAPPLESDPAIVSATGPSTRIFDKMMVNRAVGDKRRERVGGCARGWVLFFFVSTASESVPQRATPPKLILLSRPSTCNNAFQTDHHDGTTYLRTRSKIQCSICGREDALASAGPRLKRVALRDSLRPLRANYRLRSRVDSASIGVHVYSADSCRLVEGESGMAFFRESAEEAAPHIAQGILHAFINHLGVKDSASNSFAPLSN